MEAGFIKEAWFSTKALAEAIGSVIGAQPEANADGYQVGAYTIIEDEHTARLAGPKNKDLLKVDLPDMGFEAFSYKF